jgi:tetratricopeptide (TPR) repeat protein
VSPPATVPSEDSDGDGAPAAPGPAPLAPFGMFGALALLGGSELGTVFSLALLYAPALLFLLTLVEPVGSFGVAFRRDFGPLLACTYMCWAAARLPFAIAGLAAAGLPQPAGMYALVGLWMAGKLAFGGLMVVAVRTIFGARIASALTVVGLAYLSFLLQPFLPFFGSPFLLYFAYQFLRGDVTDISWSYSARQSHRRHLEASTLNPRDAGAHYQIGLIHQQRRQVEQAEERFRKAVEIDPGEVDAHYQLGRLARQKGNGEEALRHFEAVVARDPAHARHEVWREIGNLYLESGQAEHARWALEKYVGQRTHDPEGLYLMGDALSRLGQEEPAREQWKACIEAADTTPGYRRHEVGPWRKRAAQRLARKG